MMNKKVNFTGKFISGDFIKKSLGIIVSLHWQPNVYV